jgi:hypothetical protein
MNDKSVKWGNYLRVTTSGKVKEEGERVVNMIEVLHKNVWK